MSWFYWFTLLYFILFVFSTKTSTCNNYSYQKYNQETKNNSSFSKHQCLKFVCLSLQKRKKLKHLQFRFSLERKNRICFDTCIVKIMSNQCETLEHFCFAQTWNRPVSIGKIGSVRYNNFFIIIVIPFVKLVWNICRGWLVFHSVQRKGRCFYCLRRLWAV